MKKPLVLVILDGWGISKKKEGNAVLLASTPNYNRFLEYSHTQLEASGLAVGLPSGTQGNSETGHLNIGAGRIVKQDLVRINESIANGSFFSNNALVTAAENCKKNNSAFHIMGLVQDQGVHAHEFHLYSIIKFCHEQGLKDVVVHCFTDGRDTPPSSAKVYLKRLDEVLKREKTGKIGTVIGRYYSMDRDTNWTRTEVAYNALVNSRGEKAKDAFKAIDAAYKAGETDEFIKPRIIGDFSGIKDNDSIVFFNYRTDRSRQITKAFTEEKFKFFKREKKKTVFVCMAEYYKGANAHIAFPQINMDNLLGKVLADNGLRQLRAAETEKYAHVTFFFNGGIEKPNKNEDRILVSSPKVATYDLKPEMSAYEVTEKVVDAVESGKYDVVIMNFANGDMVGHTGVLKAAIKAVETIDKSLGKIVNAVLVKNGEVIITADHGNCEQMIDEKTHKTMTAHSLNPVPFIIVSEKKYKLRKGVLADIAPTMLELLKIPKPKEMTGKSLIQHN